MVGANIFFDQSVLIDSKWRRTIYSWEQMTCSTYLIQLLTWRFHREGILIKSSGVGHYLDNLSNATPYLSVQISRNEVGVKHYPHWCDYRGIFGTRFLRADRVK